MWRNSSTSSGVSGRRWEGLPIMKRAGAPPFISSASSVSAGSESLRSPASVRSAPSGPSDLALQGSVLRVSSRPERNTTSSHGTSSEKSDSLSSKSADENKAPSSEPPENNPSPQPENPSKKKLVLPFPVQPVPSASGSGSSRRRTYDRTNEEDLGPELVVKKEAIDRDCLRCERHFVAPNRFIRLCSACSKWAAYVHTPHFEGW